MMRRLILVLAVILLAPFPAFAQQVEARAVAIANNCKPTKIEVSRQTSGPMGEVVFLVTCENKTPAPAPSATGATTGAAASPPTTLHITCQQKLCVARR